MKKLVNFLALVPLMAAVATDYCVDNKTVCDTAPISKYLANREKVQSLVGQPGWPRDGRGSLFARPQRTSIRNGLK